MKNVDEVDWSFLETVDEKGLLDEAISELLESDRICRDERIRARNARLMCSLIEASAYMKSRYYKRQTDESCVPAS